jgi:hypothetical protein
MTEFKLVVSLCGVTHLSVPHMQKVLADLARDHVLRGLTPKR